jgi:hypothetical protein
MYISTGSIISIVVRQSVTYRADSIVVALAYVFLSP